MSRPLVSVVIPSYNGEDFLGETIESALAQDYEPVEIIVVDDGSSDCSVEIARSYAGVEVIEQVHRGGGEARNTGILAARGEFVANVDHDDVLPIGKLHVQVGRLLERPELAATLGRQEWINPPPNLKRDLVYGELDGIPISSIVARTSVLRELGGFIDDQGGDIDLLVRLRENGYEFEILPDLVLYRRYHGANWLAGSPITKPLPFETLKAKLDRERARQRVIGADA